MTFTPGQLVVRTKPCTGYAEGFMKEGHNYWVESLEDNNHIKVVGSDGVFDASKFRPATLDDAYNQTHGTAPGMTEAEKLFIQGAMLSAAGVTPVLVSDEPAALDTQVGGDHYKKYPKGYQPIEIAEKLKLSPCQFNVLKYLLRFEDKNGEADIDKAIHCLKLLKQIRYGETI